MSNDTSWRFVGSRADLSDATVVLTHGRETQVLYSTDGFVDEPHFDVPWAGDLDGDRKLDLVVNLSRKYSLHPYRLLLSSVLRQESSWARRRPSRPATERLRPPR
jgi:hypothetical protein